MEENCNCNNKCPNTCKHKYYKAQCICHYQWTCDCECGCPNKGSNECDICKGLMCNDDCLEKVKACNKTFYFCKFCLKNKQEIDEHISFYEELYTTNQC